ncbi:hypothetical protein PtrM4_057930 [Pyrenophora tritici-repentis]|uniref:Uncharacterized protein n=1 Tax=Pyrenophora tritici-repentis TaxID=45151 RepID=A0A317AH77_9PLEO|nr:hypothetical protein PtrM4_057930 [Pyrenophora tritici-repentis]
MFAAGEVIHHNIIVPGVSLLFYAVPVPSTLGTVDAVASVSFTTRHCQSLLGCFPNLGYPKWSPNFIEVCKQPIMVFLPQDRQMQDPLIELFASAQVICDGHVDVKI